MIVAHRYQIVVIEPVIEGSVRRGAVLCYLDGEPVYEVLVEHDGDTGITTLDPLHQACRFELPLPVFDRLADLVRDLRLRLAGEAAAL